MRLNSAWHHVGILCVSKQKSAQQPPTSLLLHRIAKLASHASSIISYISFLSCLSFYRSGSIAGTFALLHSAGANQEKRKTAMARAHARGENSPGTFPFVSIRRRSRHVMAWQCLCITYSCITNMETFWCEHRQPDTNNIPRVVFKVNVINVTIRRTIQCVFENIRKQPKFL